MPVTASVNRGWLGLAATAFVLAFASGANAGPREQAKRMHDRLVGVPPSEAVLDQMAASITGGDAIGAAFVAMQNPSFYNTTVRDLATPWTNREQSVYAPLNDATATVIGMVRDDVPFDQLLYADLVYVGSNAATNVAYEQGNNDHYEDLADRGADLSDPANLVAQTQSTLPGTPLAADATAGIMTTRGFAEAFLVAGTNRAAVRFALLNHVCMDQEEFRDVTAYSDRVRQDVSRSPGGDANIYLNDCLSCHAGLDGLSGAFAYYDFDEDTTDIRYTPGAVHPKNLNDAGVFRWGFETTDDSWLNFWRTGPNAFVGWNGPGFGNGAKSLGMEISQTRQFAVCQVEQVFEKVCYRKPNGTADIAEVERVANVFESENRNLKRVFAETATYCMGD